jgi:hypothetical protein
MSNESNSPSGSPGPSRGRSILLILVVAVVAGLLWQVMRRPGSAPETGEPASNTAAQAPAGVAPEAEEPRTATAVPRTEETAAESARTPEQRVAGHLERVLKDRRAVVVAMAKQAGLEIPTEVTKFFDLLQAGKFQEARAIYHLLSGARNGGENSRALQVLFPAINEAFGVAEVAHEWPARELLAYGEAVLGSLRPGMAYFGGSDAGRSIPTLLDDGVGAERRIILTQNSLADATYVEYLNFVHGGRIASLTSEDSERAFVDYLNDAKERALHDRQSPNEPKRLRPGENVVVDDLGRIQVGGPVAVMAINELQVKALIAKNPGIGFAMEESTPLAYLRSEAAPLGPILELRAGAGAVTEEVAGQATEYWRSAAERILEGGATPEAASTSGADGGVGTGAGAGAGSGSDRATREAWARMAAAQGSLLEEHQQPAAAEEILRLAVRLAPGNQDAVLRLLGFLDRTGRQAAMNQFMAELAAQGAEQRALLESVRKELNLPAPAPGNP